MTDNYKGIDKETDNVIKQVTFPYLMCRSRREKDDFKAIIGTALRKMYQAGREHDDEDNNL